MNTKVSDSNKIAEKKRGNPNPVRKFQPGQSGNPGGRKKMPDDIREAFKAMTPLAIEKLKGIIESDKTRDTDRLKAIEIALDRGFGKPVQAVDLDAKNIPQVIFMGADDVPK